MKILSELILNYQFINLEKLNLNNIAMLKLPSNSEDY